MSRPRYERPSLIRHGAGVMNKYARAQGVRPRSHIDGVPVRELVERYGSPLFVFSERSLRAKCRELREAMARRVPRVQLAWSYKTNYLDAVCRVFHSEGAWAEVVSELELEKACKLGIAGARILFNGPYKPDRALRRALDLGSRIHLDNFDELQRLERLASASARPKVGIRVNMAVTGTPPWSRFGFNLENGQALEAARRIVSGKKLTLAGLHCHIGTFVQDTAAYREEAQKLSRFANELRDALGVEIEYLDLGGGFASRNTLHAQYLPGEQLTPSFAQYAEAIAEGLGALARPPDALPDIFLESGRALVDEAGYLISTVHATKRLPDGRRGLVLDAGLNLLHTANWYRHDVLPAQEHSGTPEPTVFYGPLCMNIDVLREGLLFPNVGPGDQVVFHDVGAYNVTQWMQFIVERPAVVMVSPSGDHAPIRRRESLETLLSQEEVPGWLGS